jgi:hypothetical protein
MLCSGNSWQDMFATTGKNKAALVCFKMLWLVCWAFQMFTADRM